MKKVITIGIALISLIAAGITIYQFSKPTPPPPKKLSTLEKLRGSYTLESWIKANRKMDLGIEVIEGNLNVDSNGIFDWDVKLGQTSTPQPRKVRIKARGKLLTSSMMLEGQQGSKFNADIGVKDAPDWGLVSASENLAIRGWTNRIPEEWTNGKKADPFQISYNVKSNGKTLLDMKNSWGVFTWVK